MQQSVETMTAYFTDTPPLYRAVRYGSDCFELIQNRPSAVLPYGSQARFCFDEATGAVKVLIERLEGAIDSFEATEIRGTVSPQDFSLGRGRRLRVPHRDACRRRHDRSGRRHRSGRPHRSGRHHGSGRHDRPGRGGAVLGPVRVLGHDEHDRRRHGDDGGGRSGRDDVGISAAADPLTWAGRAPPPQKGGGGGATKGHEAPSTRRHVAMRWRECKPLVGLPSAGGGEPPTTGSSGPIALCLRGFWHCGSPSEGPGGPAAVAGRCCPGAPR